MHICPNCTVELVSGAKFCHRCGDKVVLKSKSCPVCTQANPIASVFCHHCGFHFESPQHKKADYQPTFSFVFNQESLSEQVRQLFFKSLRSRVEEEYDIERYSDFVERFYQSKFHSLYTARASQIAEDVWVQWDRFGKEALPEIDRRVHEAFEGLLDYFIIQFCPDLSGMILPETILKYEKVQVHTLKLWAMAQDYLAFDREDETFYFNFVEMDKEVLAQACKNYLKASRDEKVFVICDLSLKQNGKEGFALTDKGIYWKNAFGKARSVDYKELRHLKYGKDWILLNGYFFTVNPAFNLKMYKFLKKLRQLNACMPFETHSEATQV